MKNIKFPLQNSLIVGAALAVVLVAAFGHAAPQTSLTGPTRTVPILPGCALALLCLLLLAVKRDVREHTQAQEALQRTNRDLRSAQDDLERRVAERTDDLKVVNEYLHREVAERREAEVALARSEQRFRFLADSMPQIVWTAQPDGNLDYYNQRWLDYTGMTFAESRDWGWQPILHPDDLQNCVDRWTHSFTTGAPYEVEYRFKRALDGAYRWHLGRALPLRDDAGQIVLWAGTCTDIDDYKRTETELRAAHEQLEERVADRTALLGRTNEALRQSHEKMSAIVEASPVAIFTLNCGGRLQSWSAAAERMFGWSEQEVLGGPLPFIPDDKRDETYALVQKLLMGETFTGVEARRCRRDGGDIDISISAAPLRDGAGAIVGAMAVLLDVTERNRAEQAQKRLTAILEATPDYVGMADATGRTVYWNAGSRRMLGYGLNEDLTALAISNVHPAWAARLIQDEALPAALRDGSWTGETAFLAHDGREIPTSQVIIAHRAPDGTPEFFSTIARDVSEQKAQAHELIGARDQALASVRAKSEFLANMSHEIRTPMNGVIGMTALLLDTALSNEQREYAQTIHHSADALLTVINDILDFSKIESGKLSVEEVPLDLREMLEEVGGLLGPAAYGKGLELGCLVPPDFPRRVLGDPVRLRQVLTNLVGNAIKFTPSGEVTIEARLLHESGTHAEVQLEVRDTGIGIAPERQAAIFDSFTQADGSTTRRYGGTGLGLTISRQLTELMGGRMELDSAPGRGSAFRITLSLRKDLGLLPLCVPPPPDLRGARVLIVDDNATNRLILREQLRSWQCRPEEAESGAEALQALRASVPGDRFQAALLDMQMPDMDGEQLAGRIKSEPDLADLPLILLSSSGSRGTASEMQAKGFRAALVKPVRQSHLLDALVESLDGALPLDLAVAPEEKQTVGDAPPSGLRILLAEDNSVNLKVALRVLEKWGCRTDAVGTGREAVRAWAAGPYDAILMDIQMPEMDGLEATAQIRRREQGRGSHVPIIAMTAHAMDGDRERCLAGGMDDYVAKPLRSDLLAAALARWAPQKSDSDPPTFNERRLREATGDDQEFIAQLLAEFLTVGPDYLGRLGDAVRAEDATQIGAVAHALKGSAATVGAEALARACANLERAAKSGALADTAMLLARIENEWERLRSQLPDYYEVAKAA